MSLGKLKREQIAGLIGVLGVNPIDNKIRIVYINDKTEYADGLIIRVACEAEKKGIIATWLGQTDFKTVDLVGFEPFPKGGEAFLDQFETVSYTNCEVDINTGEITLSSEDRRSELVVIHYIVDKILNHRDTLVEIKLRD